MDDGQAEWFEVNRPHLRSVAYRMLGSLSEADDAVQEAWLRLNRSDTTDVDNLVGWLTTVVGRVCLDMLRSRRSRREEPMSGLEPQSQSSAGVDPEQEALLADSIGLAMLVVLETLAPAERLAFVLHDMFAVPFDEIAPVIGRSPAAARQLASRARRRVHGAPAGAEVDLIRRREVVEAYLAASRGGDFDALLAVLDPDVVLRADRAAVSMGASGPVRGAPTVAQQALAHRAAHARPAMVNGSVGLGIAPRGRLVMVIGLTIVGDLITEIEVIAEPDRLSRLDLAVIDH